MKYRKITVRGRKIDIEDFINDVISKTPKTVKFFAIMNIKGNRLTYVIPADPKLLISLIGALSSAQGFMIPEDPELGDLHDGVKHVFVYGPNTMMCGDFYITGSNGSLYIPESHRVGPITGGKNLNESAKPLSFWIGG